MPQIFDRAPISLSLSLFLSWRRYLFNPALNDDQIDYSPRLSVPLKYEFAVIAVYHQRRTSVDSSWK